MQQTIQPNLKPLLMQHLRVGLMALLVSLYVPSLAHSQDSLSAVSLGSQYFDKVSSKAAHLEGKLDKTSEKALSQLKKQEERMRKKLMKIDSLAANNVFANADKKYKELKEKLGHGQAGQYIPKLDTLVTSLKFLQANPQLLAQAKEAKEKLKNALEKANGLKDQFQKAEAIKQFLKERRQFLKDQLSKFGFAKELKKLNNEVYYYGQHIAEYKEILKDSKKTERKALELLSKTKLFKDFMRKNSQLASLFRLPDPDNPMASQVSLAGLQTRVQVNQLIQGQIASGGPGARQQFSQNLQAAQAQLSQLRVKVAQYGGGGSDQEMPDFKPNNQKTKSFLDRLEYGTNIQTQKANSIFPVTSDIGLSLGYKLNDKSIIGIGSSFKMGWGTGFRDIRITSQGVGLRSYVDYKLKGSFWLSGGFEMNYRSEIREISLLRDYSAWQRSGLLGISKKVSLKTEFFKKAKLQLLWDFLSYEQVPRTQSVILRIGYTL